MDRVVRLLEIRSVHEDERVIEGWASRIEKDRANDVVLPRGAKFRLPLPLLWAHRADEPVGAVESARVTDEGIFFRARFAKVSEPGPLKDRLDDAWQSVKAQLTKFVSIGFRPIESDALPTGGRRFKVWEWLELSVCTIPMNGSCEITAIKALDDEIVARATSPGVAGKPPILSFKKADPEIWAALCSADEADDNGLAELLDEARGIREEMKAYRDAASIKDVRTYSQDSHDSLIGVIAATRHQNRHLASIVRRLLGRVVELETATKAAPGLQYRGTFRTGETYSEGDFLTHDGSLWHCRTFTTLSPRDAPTAWQLAVKRGKDAR